MKLYHLMAGDTDLEGNDQLVDTFASYEAAMIEAQKQASYEQLNYARDSGFTEELGIISMPMHPDSGLVGRVTLHRAGTNEPVMDYWWSVREMELKS